MKLPRSPTTNAQLAGDVISGEERTSAGAMSQGELFSSDIPEWEIDAANTTLAASVVFAEPPYGPFYYRVPEELAGTIRPGMRVLVPLGKSNREIIGYCMEVESISQPPSRIKPILQSIDLQPLCNATLLKLVQWMSKYYIVPVGQVFEAIVPSGVRTQAGTRVKTLLSLGEGASDSTAVDALPKKQRQVLQQLILACEPLTVEQLQKMAECSSAPINALRDRGLITARSERVMDVDSELLSNTSAIVTAPALTADQRIAFAAIREALDSSKHQTLLLHGITGSGKTEVYMRAIEHTLTFGRQSIVLVPEISLTPQTKRRFQDRFGAVAVMHSHMSDSERHYQWRKISDGEAKVVVGARSAIFAPVPRLGLIILDEEHENSFKQNTVPRYHARDVALQRAFLEQIPLILGSATPSLETFRRAQQGQYRLLTLPRRIHNRPLPQVELVDMRHQRIDPNRGALSKPLGDAMRSTLQRKGQIMLLLNRRGFATTIQCPKCGGVLTCPDCDLPLTHHHDGSKAVCHYCDYTIPTPPVCSKCGFEGLRFAGHGTQRLEIEIAKFFPDATLARMDADSMKKPGSHEATLSEFKSGETNILLGTQMIAKGLDFPNVLLVGVINADSGLHFPDFRAAERTFQLVTQVAGRGGRGEKPGKVIVQTYSPEHFAIALAQHHDYLRFAAEELQNREKFGYPPYGSMARIIIRGTNLAQAEAYAKEIANTIDSIRKSLGLNEVRYMGPAPPPLARLQKYYRFHIMLLSTSPQALNALLARVDAELKTPDNVQYMIDVDPVEML